MEKVSIRKAKNAKTGLVELISWCKENSLIPLENLVELGSYVGDSTEIFATHFKEVFAIDPWENGYDDTDASSYKYPMSMIEKQFDEMSKNYNNITKIKSYSLSEVDIFEDEVFDMVYIDGIHQYEAVKEDIKAWYSKVQLGGVIAGHDYQPSFQGCIDAVHEVLGEPEVVTKDTSWAFIKRKQRL
jgi:predicted O-methyltransferase YrrM